MKNIKIDDDETKTEIIRVSNKVKSGIQEKQDKPLLSIV